METTKTLGCKDVDVPKVTDVFYFDKILYTCMPGRTASAIRQKLDSGCYKINTVTIDLNTNEVIVDYEISDPTEITERYDFWN